jgi:hypothetical protein
VGVQASTTHVHWPSQEIPADRMLISGPLLLLKALKFPGNIPQEKEILCFRTQWRVRRVRKNKSHALEPSGGFGKINLMF